MVVRLVREHKVERGRHVHVPSDMKGQLGWQRREIHIGSNVCTLGVRFLFLAICVVGQTMFFSSRIQKRQETVCFCSFVEEHSTANLDGHLEAIKVEGA